MLICNCCCGNLAIIVYNSNGAIDDNFEILLNGTSLGTIDNNQNNCTGRIFTNISGLTAPLWKVSGSPLTCGSGIFAFESNLSLNESLFVSGTNTLRITVTQDNGNGNFGTIRVAKLVFDGSYYVETPTYLGTTYNFASAGTPNNHDYTFSY